MKRILLASSMLALVAVGCEVGLEGDSSVATARVTSALTGAEHDVAGFLYEIACDNGFTLTQYVPLEEETLPPWLDPDAGENHPFADLFSVIPPGNCTVTATPMQNETTPSVECHPVTDTFTVYPEQTTEIVLMAQCDGDPNGAGDIAVGLNDPPIVTGLELDPSKFVCDHEPLVISATAEDPNGDVVTYTWTVTNWPEAPAPGSYSLTSTTGNPVTFVGNTVGAYELTLTVTDPYGASTSLVFPAHVSDCGCSCPEGYEVNPDGSGCTLVQTAQATANSIVYNVCRSRPNPNYSRDGAMYPGGTVAQIAPWGVGYNQSPSRLNDVGVWACESTVTPGSGVYADESPIGEWIGFSVCLDIESSGDYLVGMGADNRMRFWLNGNLAFDKSAYDIRNFTYWWIETVHLDAGPNIIELEGYNDGQAAAFGAEIAGPFPAGSLNSDAAMMAADYMGNLIFSTQNAVGMQFTIGEQSGYTCPDGWAFDSCNPQAQCVFIDHQQCE